MSDIANVGKRPGIRYPKSVMSSLRSWIPGDVAPSAQTTAIINHGGARIGITLTGIDPRREAQVSKLASQMREGKLEIFHARRTASSSARRWPKSSA